MREQIKTHGAFCREELFAQLAIVLIFGFLGSLFMLFIVRVGMAGEEEGTWFLLGALMAVIGCVMVGITMGMLSYVESFNMMVSMGRTRKEFYAANFVTAVINNFLGMAAILIFAVLERGVGRLVYKDVEYKALETVFFDFRVIIGYVLGMAVLRMLLGALFLKFGNRIMWGLGGSGMLICVFLRNIEKAAADKNTIVMWLIGAGKGFLNLAGILQVLIMAAISAVLLLLAWLLTRRGAVKV